MAITGAKEAYPFQVPISLRQAESLLAVLQIERRGYLG